jgi:hypothetical protein
MATTLCATATAVFGCARQPARGESTPSAFTRGSASTAVDGTDSAVAPEVGQVDASTADADADAAAAPPTFPPPAFYLAVQARRALRSDYVLGELSAASIVALFLRAPAVMDMDSAPLVLLRLEAGECAPLPSTQVAGLPSFGFADLNHEPDRLFGHTSSSPRIETGYPSNVCPGHHSVETLGGDSKLPRWIVTRRGGPGLEVGDLYGWRSNRWARLQGADLNHVWHFPHSFGGAEGVLPLERDGVPVSQWPAMQPLRLRAFGVASGTVIPALEPRADDAKCNSRVTDTGRRARGPRPSETRSSARATRSPPSRGSSSSKPSARPPTARPGSPAITKTAARSSSGIGR